MRIIPATMQKTKSNLYLTLTTECLTLRKPELKDAAQFAVIRSNDAVNRYLNRHSLMNTGEARAFIKTIRNGIKAGKSYYWAISFTGDHKLIGAICIWNLDEEKSTAEVGYELHPDFQRKGLMHEALKAVLQFGFERLFLEQIRAFTHEANERSIKLLAQTGFEREKGPEGDLYDQATEAEMAVYCLNNPNKKARLG